jgi:hypothetical protein
LPRISDVENVGLPGSWDSGGECRAQGSAWCSGGVFNRSLLQVVGRRTTSARLDSVMARTKRWLLSVYDGDAWRSTRETTDASGTLTSGRNDCSSRPPLHPIQISRPQRVKSIRQASRNPDEDCSPLLDFNPLLWLVHSAALHFGQDAQGVHTVGGFGALSQDSSAGTSSSPRSRLPDNVSGNHFTT